MIDELFIEIIPKGDERIIKRIYNAFVAENQVRKKKGTALGKRYAKYWMDDISEISSKNLP